MKKQKSTTPLKAVRKYCLWCCENQTKEVQVCPKKGCPLYNFRFGRKILGGKTLKFIKARCLDCGEGTPQAVNKCEFIDCLLFPYKDGKNPARKGVGGNISHLRPNQKNGGAELGENDK